PLGPPTHVGERTSPVAALARSIGIVGAMLGEGRGVGAVLGIAALVLLSAASVRAEPAAPADATQRELAAPLDAAIEIEHAAGSEACPHSPAVFRAMRRLFPERSLRQSTSPSVSAAQARVV